MEILFIQTGGTIDKLYAEKSGVYNFDIQEPAIKRILERIEPNFEYKIISLLKKDSLDITAEDRERIYLECFNSKENKIIISHGTDTIVKTAEVLSKIKDKSIILFGSKKPEKFKDSDAEFNFGTAIGAINILDKGIFIAMNGRIYSWDKCEKDPNTANFISKD